MNEFFAGSATIGVVISLIFYFFGIWLKEKFKSSLINPLLISIRSSFSAPCRSNRQEATGPHRHLRKPQ